MYRIAARSVLNCLYSSLYSLKRWTPKLMRHPSYMIAFFLVALVWNMCNLAQAQEDEQLKYYRQTLRPILKQHCYSCHNEPDKKGGLNLERFDFIVGIIKNGPTWVNVVDQIRSGEMPPSVKPPIPADEKKTLIEGIEAILDSALSEPDPGQVVLRRLSNREYRYTVLDVLGVDFDTRAFFPADASGGEGFDNQAKVLYITPLLMERYFAASDSIVTKLSRDAHLWSPIRGASFPPSGWQKMRLQWSSFVQSVSVWTSAARSAAAKTLYPLALRAYRRPLDNNEKVQLMDIFTEVYEKASGSTSARFDLGIQESIKYMLVSPHFLYRREEEQPVSHPYPVSNFELASRLSYFLWSSGPDDALLDAAYREDLHDPSVMRKHIVRMLADPKSRRLAESFASQWLEIDDLLDVHEVDVALFPEFSLSLRKAMYDEAVSFVHHVFTERRNLLDLIDSDYTFLNQSLAAHYGLNGVEGDELRLVALNNRTRGGVLGLGSVLTMTSFPTRTSPVNRGKWVLEQLLGTPPPPPPADVPELEEQASNEAEPTLGQSNIRDLLLKHRESPACFQCHQRMDPLGIGLENFDAIGRWRDTYGVEPVDAFGELANGVQFNGPAELKQILLTRKALFARNFSRKMLSFALGRSIRFQDKRTVDALTNTLLDTDFDSVAFIQAVASSYPFRYKKSDPDIETEAP